MHCLSHCAAVDRRSVYAVVSRRLITLAAGTLVLCGCSPLPTVKSTLTDAGVRVPAQWSSPFASRGRAPAVREGWVADLASPHLSPLIDEAIARNFELKRASARVQAARARARIAGAALKPQVNGEVTGSRRGVPAGGGTRSSSNAFDGVLNASWEIDLWERLSGETRAAALDASAITADYLAARLSVAANVAQAWFNAVEAKLQLELAHDTVVTFRDNLQIVVDGFRGGLNDALDVRLERANLASAESRLHSRSQSLDAALRQLETLLGRYPSAQLKVDAVLPAPVAPIPAGIPAQVLARRPDVLAASRRLAASDNRVAVASTNAMPRITLTAQGGVSSAALQDLFDFDALLWNIASSLTAPIFRAGELQAERDVAAADSAQALAEYAQTVLTAFREVETALNAEQFLAQQEQALRVAASESEEAAALALERYRAGLVDIVTWLDARRRAFDANSALISTSNARLQNRIALYLALGGDFGSASMSLNRTTMHFETTLGTKGRSAANLGPSEQ